MKYKLMSAIMAFSMLVSSTIAPLAAIKSYASAEIEENPTIMNEKIDEVGNDEKPNEISDTKLDIPDKTEEINENSPVETKTEEEKSGIQAEEETKKETTTEENLEEEIEEKVKIVKKSVDVDLYEDSSYYTISNEDIDIKITGQMPENGTIKAYEVQNPIIDMEKENVLGFGFEIFDKDGNLYDKNLADEYEIEIRSEKISDLDKIYIYEKNKNNVRFTETRDFSKLSDKVKVVSKADEFAIAKDIEKEEKQTQIEKTSKEEKSPFLSTEDKKVVNEKNSAEKEIEQPKDILDSLTNSAIEKQDTEASNEIAAEEEIETEKADEKTSSDLEPVDWKKDLLDALAGNLEDKNPVDEENTEETSDNEETVKEDNQSENLTTDLQVTDEKEEGSEVKTDATTESDKNEESDKETSKGNIEKSETNEEIEEKLTYQQVLADIYTDRSYGQKADDQTRIKLSGKLPGYTKVKAYPVEIKIEGQEVLAAYDIKIFDEDDNEYKVTSKNDVNVQITNQKIIKASEVEVYHKENEFAPEEKIKVDSKANDTVNFKAESFSIYAVTDPKAQATRTYEFYIRDEDGSLKLINTQTIRSGEMLQKPPVPILEDRGRYAGWFPIGEDKVEHGSNEVHFFTPITFDTKTPVTIKAEPLFLDNAYIDFKERVYITEKNKDKFTIPAGYTLASDGYYKDANGNKLYRDEVFKTRVQNFGEAIGEAHIPVVKDEAPTNPDEPAPILSYWSINPDGGPIFDFANTPITRDLIKQQEAISGENQVSKLDLFAIYEYGYTVSFDSQGGSHVTRQIVKAGNTLDLNKLIDPIKPGYKFVGWSLTPNGPVLTDLKTRVISHTKTLYAIYEQLPGTYTVSHYTENINDGNYTFYKSETKSAPVGSKTPDGEYFRNARTSPISADLLSRGYTKPTDITPSESSKLIKGDGSTDIKVYHKRPRYILNVYSTGVFQGVPTFQFSMSFKEGEDTNPAWIRMKQIRNSNFEVRDGSLSGDTIKTPGPMPAREWNLYFVPTIGSSDWFVKFIEVDQNDQPVRDENGNLKVFRTEAHNAIISGVEVYRGGAEIPGFIFRYVTEPGKTSDNPKVYKIGEPREVRTFYRRQTYQLIFKTNNILYNDKQQVVPFDDQLSKYIPTSPTPGMVDKNGAIFKGWYDNPEFTGVPVDFTNIRMPAKDTTYHGKWEQEKYTVRIYKEMTTPGQSVGPGKMEEFLVDRNTKLSKDDSMLTAIKPEKIKNETDVKLTWYRFSGFQFEPYDFNEPITSPLFLYPVWQYHDPVTNTYRPLEDIHVITYTDGKNSFKDENLYLNNAAAILKAPYILNDVNQLDSPNNLNGKYFGNFQPPAGKHFQGWLLNNDPSRIYRPGEVINVTSDMKFFAKWGEYKKTQITLYEQKPGTDKGLSKTETIRENGTIKLPTPTAQNYVFDGWSKTPNGNVDFKAGQEVMVTNENLPNQLYGIWKANRTINVNEKQPTGTIKTYSLNPDATNKIKLTKPQSINGYKFLGWSTQEGATTPQYSPDYEFTISETNPVPEKLYGVWQKLGRLTLTSTFNPAEIKNNKNTVTYTVTIGANTQNIELSSGVPKVFENIDPGTKIVVTQTNSFAGVKTTYSLNKETPVVGLRREFTSTAEDMTLAFTNVANTGGLTFKSNFPEAAYRANGEALINKTTGPFNVYDNYNKLFHTGVGDNTNLTQNVWLLNSPNRPLTAQTITIPVGYKFLHFASDKDPNYKFFGDVQGPSLKQRGDVYTAIWSPSSTYEMVIENQEGIDVSAALDINYKAYNSTEYGNPIRINGVYNNLETPLNIRSDIFPTNGTKYTVPTYSNIDKILVSPEENVTYELAPGQRIETPYGYAIEAQVLDKEYPGESTGDQGFNQKIKLIITRYAPVPTGIVDNFTPTAIMLAIAIMAFAYRLYRKNKLAGGIDE